MPVISIRDYTFTYPSGSKALDGLTLDIEEGQLVAILGPNGAGKTTLCLSLNGVIPSVITGDCSGEIAVCGLKTRTTPIYELAKYVGVTLQEPESQIFNPTVQSEVVFGPENLGIPREEILGRMKEALAVTRLDGLEKRSTNALSGGQKQRLALACAIALRPKVLVLDEPTSQLDPVGTQEVFAVVKDLVRKHGSTVVVTEHKSEEIAECADRMVLLYGGKIYADAEPHEFFANVELLEKVKVKIPQVAQVGVRLGGGPPQKKKAMKNPVTLDEAVELLAGATLSRPSFHDKRSVAEHAPFVIEVQGVWYSYPGDVVALRNISLGIKQGEFVAIIGENGSGKTTLLKNIIGLLRPSQGKILVSGEDISQSTPAELARRIGLILQNPDHQLFAISVEQEVAFGPKNLGCDDKEIARRVDEGLKLVQLEHARDLYPFRLSFGDRRKVAVAAVYAMYPEIFILDEPTTGQDYAGKYDIVEIAKKLHASGKTVLMVTHDMELVASYAERAIVLAGGELLLDDSVRAVFSQPDLLAKTHLRPPQVTRLGQRLTNNELTVLSVEEFLEAGPWLRHGVNKLA